MTQEELDIILAEGEGYKTEFKEQLNLILFLQSFLNVKRMMLQMML